MRKITALVSFVLLAYGSSYAQTIETVEAPTISTVVASPQFFTALIVGLILAVGFQLVLTAISIGSGILAIGNVKEEYAESQHEFNEDDDDDDEKPVHKRDVSTPTGVKLVRGFGIWSLITTSIALFGATALAMNLTAFESVGINISLALTIWAAFFVSMVYIETKFAATTVGNLVTFAMSGLKATGSAIKNMVTPSQTTEMKKVAKYTLNELQNNNDNNLNIQDQLDNSISKFFSELDNRMPKYDTLKGDIKEIFSETRQQDDTLSWDQMLDTVGDVVGKYRGSAHSNDGERAESLENFLKGLRESNNNDQSQFAPNQSNELTEKADEFLQKAKSILENADVDGLKPEQLEKEIVDIIENPKQTGRAISKKLESLDKDSVVKILTNNTSLEKSTVENAADKVGAVINKVKTDVLGYGEGNTSVLESVKQKVESKVKSFFNSTGRDELDYDMIKNEVIHVINNPKDTLEIAKNRLNKLDKDSYIALLTSNTSLSKEQIAKVEQTIEDAKSDVMSRINSMEAKAKQKAKMVERKAVIQLEAIRKTAAAAALWLVATAIFSAGAAIAGSILV